MRFHLQHRIRLGAASVEPRSVRLRSYCPPMLHCPQACCEPCQALIRGLDTGKNLIFYTT